MGELYTLPPFPQMLDFFAEGEMQVAFDTEYGEDEDREVTMFGVTFKVVALPDLLAVGLYACAS